MLWFSCWHAFGQTGITIFMRQYNSSSCFLAYWKNGPLRLCAIAKTKLISFADRLTLRGCVAVSWVFGVWRGISFGSSDRRVCFCAGSCESPWGSWSSVPKHVWTWCVGKEQVRGLLCSPLLLNAPKSVCICFKFLNIVEKFVFLNIFVLF